MTAFLLFLYAASLIRVPNGGIQPRAAIDRDNRLHLLYYLGEQRHGDLFYVRSSDFGATWSAPLRVNSEPGTAIAAGTIRGGQLAIGRNGRVHVAWNASSNGAMFYSRLNESKTAFEPQRNLMTHTSGLDGGGAVAADSAGNVYVAWHGKAEGAPQGEAGRAVWIAKSGDDGKTFAAEQRSWQESTGACGCCGLAIFADAAGDVRVLYRSATENVHRDIYLLSSRGPEREFRGRKLHTWDINACPMTSMDFAQADTKVEGAWETAGQVYFEDLTNANAAPVSGTGEGKNRKHPRLAIAPNGDTLMVWTEGTGWGKGGSLAWQLYDTAGKSIGEKQTVTDLPAWSFGAAIAKPGGGFVILY